MQALVIAARNLRRRTIRTVFALMGIAVGVSMVISIISSARGLQGQFYRMAEEFRGDLIVTQKSAFIPMQSEIKASTAAGLVSPKLAGASLVRIWRQPVDNPAKIQQAVMVLGIRPDDIALGRYPVTRGRALKAGDEDRVLIGELMARDFGWDIGDEVEVLRKKFKICGLFKSPIANVPFLSGGVLMTLEAMCKARNAEVEPSGNFVILHVKGADAIDASGANAAMRELGERVAAVKTELSESQPSLKIQAIDEYLDSFSGQLEVVDQFAWAISLLAIVAGGIGIMNTMIMSVFERTREIGLLKAIGWPPSLIMLTIVAEGAVLSALGGIVGVPLGLILVKAASMVIKLGLIEVTWDWGLTFQAIGLAVVVGALGSIYPAARAAQLSPTEALRYE